MRLGRQPMPHHRRTVEYCLITRQPDDADGEWWEQSSTYTEDEDYIYRRLALRRSNKPGHETRVAVRTITVKIDVVPEKPQA